ncbi:MAG: 3-dehydroquinate synthase [Candidatus Aminicenantes bacterium]
MSKILVGERLKNLPRYLPTTKCILITDTYVKNHYHHLFPDIDIIELESGEHAKSLETIEEIYTKLLDFGADRSSFIIGIGGGVVCDLTGFAASTYMRGLNFGFVATSLLAQVDASIGGKNAVNFRGYKNIVGTFNQPRFVICDLELLDTLPEREVFNGFAEVLKHALIGDRELFSFLEDRFEKGDTHDYDFFRRIVHDSIAVKASVVDRDERESGERRILNFGHTLGHAIENVTNLSHGEAVSLGITFAVRYSEKEKKLGPEESARILSLLHKMELLEDSSFDKKKALEAIKKDKKREAEGLHFVFLKGIGLPEVVKISLHELEDSVNDLC